MRPNFAMTSPIDAAAARRRGSRPAARRSHLARDRQRWLRRLLTTSALAASIWTTWVPADQPFPIKRTPSNPANSLRESPRSLPNLLDRSIRAVRIPRPAASQVVPTQYAAPDASSDDGETRAPIANLAPIVPLSGTPEQRLTAGISVAPNYAPIVPKNRGLKTAAPRAEVDANFAPIVTKSPSTQSAAQENFAPIVTKSSSPLPAARTTGPAESLAPIVPLAKPAPAALRSTTPQLEPVPESTAADAAEPARPAPTEQNDTPRAASPTFEIGKWIPGLARSADSTSKREAASTVAAPVQPLPSAAAPALVPPPAEITLAVEAEQAQANAAPATREIPAEPDHSQPQASTIPAELPAPIVQPPAPITRGVTKSSVAPSFSDRPAPPGRLARNAAEEPAVEPGILTVDQRKSVQIRTVGAIRRLEVQNPDVCETLQFAAGEVSIVGKRAGETRLAVWVTGQPDPLVWCVRVSGEGKAPSRGQDDATLRRLIAELYPQSRIRLTSTEEQVIVEGQARDRQEAIQILSLIRSVRLIPVIDRVVVRDR